MDVAQSHSVSDDPLVLCGEWQRRGEQGRGGGRQGPMALAPVAVGALAPGPCVEMLQAHSARTDVCSFHFNAATKTPPYSTAASQDQALEACE